VHAGSAVAHMFQYLLYINTEFVSYRRRSHIELSMLFPVRRLLERQAIR
jgi:hypothetical protein